MFKAVETILLTPHLMILLNLLVSENQLCCMVCFLVRFEKLVCYMCGCVELNTNWSCKEICVVSFDPSWNSFASAEGQLW